MISQRIEMYKQAHENAKAEGASSKVRRLERGMKVEWNFFYLEGITWVGGIIVF